METNENNEFVLTQGKIEGNEINETEGLTSRLDDSIGLSQQKLRNSEVQELTFS